MTSKLKKLGLALIAILALNAIAISAAQAAEELHIEHPANGNKAIGTAEIVTGGPETVSQPSVFQLQPGGIQLGCKMVRFKGTESGLTDNGTSLTNSSVTATPEYEACEIAGLGAATVNTAGCHFKAYAETTRETSGTGVKQGKAELICEAGKSIGVSSAGCVIKVGSQTPEGGVNAVNTGSGSTRDIDIEIHITGVVFETNGAFACSLAGIPKVGTEATTRLNLTVKGFEDDNTAESAGKTGVYEEGPQLGIWTE